MANRKHKPRETCVAIREGEAFEVTEIGLAHVHEWGALGGGAKEIAGYFSVGVETVRQWLDPDNPRFKPDVYEAYNEGKSELNRRLRQHQIALAETNAQMAIHLGKHYLDQKDNVQEHHHVHAVVGTLPDYNQSSDDWFKDHAPRALQAADAPKRDAVAAVDATYVAIDEGEELPTEQNGETE